MKTVFYKSIRPAHGQSIHEIIKRAHALGYELVPFDGWTDSDLRSRPRGDIREQHQARNEIQDACVVHTGDGDDWPHIIQVATYEEKTSISEYEA